MDVKWMMARVVLFLAVVPSESPDIRKGPDIRKQMGSRLASWQNGWISQLV